MRKFLTALCVVILTSPLRAQGEESDRYDALILKHAQGRRLNPRLVKSIIAAESGFCRTARSPKGARGLMQVLPPTAQEMGVEARLLNDPDQNLLAGTSYLSWLYRTAWRAYGLEGVSFRDGPAWAQRRVIAAYHGGPRMLFRREWPPLTRLYVRDVFRHFRSPATVLRVRPFLSPLPDQPFPALGSLNAGEGRRGLPGEVSSWKS